MKLEAVLDTPGSTERELVYSTYKLRSTRERRFLFTNPSRLFVLGPPVVPGEIPKYVPGSNQPWSHEKHSLLQILSLTRPRRLQFLLVPVKKQKSRILSLLTMARAFGHSDGQLFL